MQTIDVSRRKDVKLLGGNQLHVSRDGSRLYVSGTNNGSLLSFLRDKTTGELTLEQTLHHSADNHNGLNGANGIAESPDGRFLYVTGEHGNAINVLRRSGAGESKPAVSQQAGGESSVTDPKSTSPAGVTGLKLFTANGKELRELKDGEYYGLDAFFKKQVEGKTPLQQLREQQLQHLKDLNREVERATEKKQKTDGKSKPDAGAAGDGEGKPIGASLKDWGRKESDLKSGLIRIEPREHILTTIEKADLVRYLGRDAQLVLKDGRIELNGKPVAEKNLEAELKKLSPVRLTISATSTELAKHVTEIAKTAARVEIKEIRITQEEAPADE